MNVLPREKQIEVIAALCDGLGVRAASRITGVNRGTVASIDGATITVTTTVNPTGAAVVGAAAASSSDDSGTDWGWVAFAVLAGLVVIFGIVWLVRRPRRA